MAELRVLPGGGPINEGERRVVAQLAAQLPTGYFLLPNIEFHDSYSGQTYEYDCICVAPHAVYAIEVKDWRGDIDGDLHEWTVNGESRLAPNKSIERKAKVLKGRLTSAMPALAPVRVEGVVILASQPASLKLSDEAKLRVLGLGKSVYWLQDPTEIGRRPNEIAALHSSILQVLTSGVRARSGPRAFRDYQVEEVLEQFEDEIIYRARHRLFPASPSVRLRVVTLSPYTLSQQQQTERRDAILREAQALHLLGPHPNIAGARDSFQDDGGRLIIVFDEPKGRALRARLGNGTPLTTTQRLDILIDVTRALARAHEGNVIHRAVEPANILVSDDMTARLCNFALAKLPLLGSGSPGATVWHDPDEAGLDSRYLAPELQNPRLLVNGKLTPAADLWSLGCLAYEMFGPTGKPPSGNLSDLQPFDDTAPRGLWSIVQGLLVLDPAARLPNAQAILPRLEALRATPSGSVMASAPAKERYERDDVIDGKYVVKRVLAPGGFSNVYRVYYAMDDQEYALKIFNNRQAHASLEREIQTLRRLPPHPHVVKAIWGDRTQDGQWYLVTEFVDGDSLAAYAEGKKRLTPAQCVEIILQLLSALETIHRQDDEIAALRAKSEISAEEYDRLQELQGGGVVHRDIKPQNLMLTSSGVKLIDFNIASRQGDPRLTQAGTFPYVPPNLGQADSAVWDADPDLFATAVVLYELLCWNHPHENFDPKNYPQPRDPRIFRPDISEELATFLLKALSPSRVDRFQSAREMRLALEAVSPLLESERLHEDGRAVDGRVLPHQEALNGGEANDGTGSPTASRSSTSVHLSTRLQTLLENAPPNVNPMVREFLGLSSQARRSNKGTRGMDDVAEATYVETRLDADLARSVLEGKHLLVLVTGNAGDGKTAFIQQVERRAKEKGAHEEERTVNRSRLRYGERVILTLYDGSQDEGERKSDEILREFLSDFRPGTQPTPNTVRLAAINEGRLRDFLSSHRDEWGAFARNVIATLDDPGAAPTTDDVVVVNLNLRSVTLGNKDSIFSRQLQAIVQGPFWEPCSRCDYRTRCPLKHNVDTLRDETSGDAVSERLHVLVDALRLRRQRHLTMRDVRSLISHLLFRDRACEEIPALLGSPEGFSPLDITYFQGVGGLGAPSQSHLERGASLLSQIDVGEVANPAQDREIASQSRSQSSTGPRLMEFPARTAENYYAELITEAQRSAGTGYEANVPLARRAHTAARRRLFFERADDAWWEMLPYHRLRQFQAALEGNEAGQKARQTLLGEIVGAISLSEGAVDPQAAQEALWLATGAPLPSLSAPSFYKCFRRYPIEEFVLQVREVSAPYVEAQSDQLQLVHQPQGVVVPGATLDIDLDLLEMLELLREGFAPLSEGTGFGVNLRLFKNRLLAENARELFLANAGEAEDGGILLRIAPGSGAGSVELSPTTVASGKREE